jgi:trk system potassium uptake protein TrkA
VNLCACKIAQTLFNLPTRIARMRSTDYADHPKLFDEEQLRRRFLDLPRADRHRVHRAADRVSRALQVLEFADGLVSLVAVRAARAARWSAIRSRTLREHIPNVDARVAAIFRATGPSSRKATP